MRKSDAYLSIANLYSAINENLIEINSNAMSLYYTF